MQRSVYIALIVASVALFLWQCHLYPTLNRDGVTYLQGAALYLTGGVKATVALGDQARWPFYSVLIAEVSRWSSLSLFTSAYLLNAVFVCLSGVFFLFILQTCSRQSGVLWMGAIVWLLWHGYTKWWPQVVRDHGGLSFFLMSLYCLLQFYQHRTFFWVVLWSLALGAATLFRFEAAIYWCLLPWVFCIVMKAPFASRLRCFFQLTSLFWAMCLGVFILFLTGHLSLDSLRFRYIANSALDYIAITRHAYVVYSSHYPDTLPFMIVLRLLWDVMSSLANVLTVLGVFAVVVAYRVKKETSQAPYSPVMTAYLIVSFFVPMAFYLQNLFLNARYVFPLCVCLLLVTTPALAYLVQHRKQGWKRYASFCLIGVLLYSGAATLHRFGNSLKDEQISGQWIQHHLSGKSVFTNSKRVFFYMTKDAEQQAFTEIRVGNLISFLTEDCHIGRYDFLALAGEPSALDDVYAQLFSLKMVGPITKRFQSSDGVMVMVMPVVENCFS